MTMELRESVRNILRRIVKDELPDIIREVVSEELGGLGEPRAIAKITVSPHKKGSSEPVRPKMAIQHNVHVGQKWKSKSYGNTDGRIIEIKALEQTKVVPRVIHSTKGRNKSVAKRIGYDMLVKRYDLM